MEEKGWIMMRVLLNRYHKGSADALLKCLPQEDVKSVLSQGVHSQEPQHAIPDPVTVLEKIHYSWLASPIQKMPEQFQPYVIASLPNIQAKNLSIFLKRPFLEIAIPRNLKNFFLNHLCENLGTKSVLPASFLPHTLLTSLLSLSKTQLMELIDLLGMHDVTPEVRQTVDKQKLRRFYNCLTPHMQLYLKQILHQSDKWTTQSLGIEHWDGNREKLLNVIHRRGLIRFAKALSGQHPHLIWHISHTLDTGRSSVISKYYSKEEIVGLTPVLSLQVGNAMTFLRKSNKMAA